GWRQCRIDPSRAEPLPPSPSLKGRGRTLRFPTAAGPRLKETSMPLIQEIDYGTPIRLATKQVTLTIDGHEVTVPEGTSIMRAAMNAGIKVPKLCATDSLSAFGSCRLCLVEIEDRPGTP